MRYTILAAAAAMGVLAGCASAGGEVAADRVAELLADNRVGQQVDKICFARTIDGFRNNTRDSVVLTRGVNTDYLVLVKGCPRLDDAQSIGLASSGTCLRSSDRLLVSDSAFSLAGSSPAQRGTCWVDAIYEWDRDAASEEASEMDDK